MKRLRTTFFTAVCMIGGTCIASETETSTLSTTDLCMLEMLKRASKSTTVASIRKACSAKKTSRIRRRVELERVASGNRFAILPHKPNYLMPLTITGIDKTPYLRPQAALAEAENYHDVETKFQISMKYLAWENLLKDGLNLHFAFTATSWWQSYNGDISAPFRETNYEPELILSWERPWRFFGLPIEYTYVSLNHQSNGQTGLLSRSWNRIIGGVVFAQTDNVTWGLRTWYRIPEQAKSDPFDAKGDDNPDIEDYLGYAEINALFNFSDQHSIEMLLRNNLQSDNRGAIQLGWSFPLHNRLMGYVEYFNGYGESLIYYDRPIERIGVGIKLTNWL